MASIFCQNCGAKANYTLQRPKFCQSCGTQFGNVSTATVNSVADVEVEEEFTEDIPNISKLEYSVDIQNSKTTLGDLFNNPLDPADLDTQKTPAKKSRRKHKKISREDFTAQSTAECAPRQGPINTEDAAG
jgi:plasmid rolling circle replication initiator protein Rep